ncbi:hypothetical protein LCGC14_1242900 [marine sediment metagenome]|uniref:Uncharacterized protein n=1 Tax=marine sediment metagenome TaxID=412755 RepID=A0A0F9NMG8_9ZZZZ
MKRTIGLVMIAALLAACNFPAETATPTAAATATAIPRAKDATPFTRIPSPTPTVTPTAISPYESGPMPTTWAPVLTTAPTPTPYYPPATTPTPTPTSPPALPGEQELIQMVQTRLAGLALNAAAEDYLRTFNKWVTWHARRIEANPYWRVYAASERPLETKSGPRVTLPGYPCWGYAKWIVLDTGVILPGLPEKTVESSECAMRVEWDLLWQSFGGQGKTFPMDRLKLTDITE